MEKCEHKNGKHQKKFDIGNNSFYWADVCNDCGIELPDQTRMYVIPTNSPLREALKSLKSAGNKY